MSEFSVEPSTPRAQRATRAKPARRILRRLWRNPLAVAAVAVIGLGLLASFLAPVLAPFPPNFTDLAASLLPPLSPGHPLGTDSAGRDIASRLLFGGQTTFAAAAVAASVAIVIGVPTGLLAGYYGGWFDNVASWCANALLSLPGIIILLAARATLGPSMWIAMAIFGVLLTPPFFRLVRTSVMAVKGELYVDAARVSGLSDSRIIARHILSVVRAPIIIQAAIVSGIAIAIQAGMEFLGLGDGTVITWGMMLNDGFRNVYIAPSLLVWPGIAIALTIGSLAVLGNALRDALEDGEPVAKARPVTVPKIKPADAAPAAVDTALLVVDNVSVAYPAPGGGLTTVVDSVSFTVDRGEVVGIVGESGSGKTQTAFSILGLLPDNAVISTGSVRFDGRTLAAADSRPTSFKGLRGSRIAYVPQEPMSNLDPAFTVGYQLMRPLRRVQGLSKAAARQRAMELLEIVGISDPARTMAAYPHQISGGMAQRVLIAGAVSGEPDLIIADEPTTALDVTVQADVLDLLRDLQQRLGVAMVIVTHNMGVVSDICDRVVVMNQSKVVEVGDVRSVLRSPREDYTRSLLDAMLSGKPARGRLTPTDGSAS